VINLYHQNNNYSVVKVKGETGNGRETGGYNEESTEEVIGAASDA
jgi:hypothetical protein